MVRTLHAGGHRGHPRRGLQPHRRGQPPGADAVLPGHRQRRLLPAQSTTTSGYYMDYTGTGNSLNMRHPHVLQLIMDSLRYWVTEMHVDGFRFDLAATLARELHDVDRLSAFFDLIQQDPVVSARSSSSPSRGTSARAATRSATSRRCGRSGTASTATPSATSGAASTARCASSPPGSPAQSDLYEATGRRPGRQHQLRHRPRRLHAGRPGVLQRQAQRGQRRGQPRRQRATTGRGTAASRARPTTRRSSRCAPGSSATSWPPCCCSQGVPMLLGGDELGRTQHGNNNAYCQDNEISWVDWPPAGDPGGGPATGSCSNSPAR